MPLLTVAQSRRIVLSCSQSPRGFDDEIQAMAYLVQTLARNRFKTVYSINRTMPIGKIRHLESAIKTRNDQKKRN